MLVWISHFIKRIEHYSQSCRPVRSHLKVPMKQLKRKFLKYAIMWTNGCAIKVYGIFKLTFYMDVWAMILIYGSSA